jgi:GTP-binding protein
MKNNIRNIAVIAHVDHGKTTLVDAMLKQSHVFRDNQAEMSQEFIMDKNELERERGITIMAKHCSIEYQGITINIIDTPGHADFSGEVERTLSMADGAILIVDAQEGPMPQTRFVLKKSLELNQKIIVVINKIDKKLARVHEVKDLIDELFLSLATDDKQLDFPVLYAIAREGAIYEQLPDDIDQKSNVEPLLQKIISFVPAPKGEIDVSFKMLISSREFDPHFGECAIGKIYQGKINLGDTIVLNGKTSVVTKLQVTKGIRWIDVSSAEPGDIISLAGCKDIQIGSTITSQDDTKTLPTPEIGKPTIMMTIGVNTSPFAGREGTYVTKSQLEARLLKELKTNIGIKMEKLSANTFQIAGRGELHLAILLETLRREGYEMEVGKPEVIVEERDGIKYEPYEEAVITVHKDFAGIISKEMGTRGAELTHMSPIHEEEYEYIYKLPTRALIGLRGSLLTATRGTLVMYTQIIGYERVGQDLPKLRRGALVAHESGKVLTYGLRTAQDRGITFVKPGDMVYEGMVVGLNAKEKDLPVNVCKGKKLTNMRSSTADIAIQLSPPVVLSLEQSIDLIESDELLEITPVSLRLRKKILSWTNRKVYNRDNM